MSHYDQPHHHVHGAYAGGDSTTTPAPSAQLQAQRAVPDTAAHTVPALLLGRAGPARPNVSWLSGTNRHAPVPVRLYLSRLRESFPLAVALVSRAAALTAKAANGCVTHMSATIGRPGSSASRSPRSGSRRERGGSCCAAAWPRAPRGWAGVMTGVISSTLVISRLLTPHTVIVLTDLPLS